MAYDRESNHPGWVELEPIQQSVAGKSNIYKMTMADDPSNPGTPLNAATTVPPDLAQQYGLEPSATIADVFRALLTRSNVRARSVQTSGTYPCRLKLSDEATEPELIIEMGWADGNKQALSFVRPGSGGTRTIVGTSGVVQNFRMRIEGDGIYIDRKPDGAIAGAHNQPDRYEYLLAIYKGSGPGEGGPGPGGGGGGGQPDSGSGGGGTYILPTAGPDTLGGVKVQNRTPGQTAPVGIDPETSLLYTRPGGGNGMKEYTCSTPAGESQKRMTTARAGVTPEEGELFAATFTNGNTASDVYLAFGGTYLQVKDGQIPRLAGYKCVFYREADSAHMLNPQGGFAPGGASSAAALPAVVPAGLPAETAANTQAILDVLVKLAGDRITPQMMGAKGDGIADDTAALRAAAAYAKEHGVELYIPADSTIKTTSNVDLWGVRFINSRGVIKPATSKLTLTIGYSKVDGCTQRINTYGGEVVIDGGSSCVYEIQNCFKITFKTSVAERKSIGYCTFYLGYCEELFFPPSDFEDGWINENRFYGGRYRKFISKRPIGHNVFYGSLVEGTDFEIEYGESNTWYNLRLEANPVNPSFKIHFGEKAVHNRLYRSYFYAYPSLVDFGQVYQNIDFVDLNGSNELIYDNGKTVCETYLVHSGSNNYNTAAIVPMPDGNIKLTGKTIYETGLIDITNGVGIRCTSGQHIINPDAYRFITAMELYDSSGKRMTGLDSKRPIFCDMPVGFEKDGKGLDIAMRYGANDFAFNVQRFVSPKNGLPTDSGVKYIKFIFSATAASVPYLRIDFYQLAKYPQPILSTIDQRLRGDVPPAEGVYKFGDIVHNTGGKDASCWGWMYKPSTGPDVPAEWKKLT